MGTVIRPARPEDKEKVAELVYLAGSGHLVNTLFDVMFGSSRDETLKYLERLFAAKSRSWFHWSRCFVAEVDGEVAATTCGYSESDGGLADLKHALVETTGWPLAAYEAMGERIRPLMKVKPSAPDDVWIVENVAAFPEFRGRGLVQSLLKTVLEKGKQQGFEQAQITFVIGNVEAQRAYERAGFQPFDEHIDGSFEKAFGAPGMKTFMRDI